VIHGRKVCKQCAADKSMRGFYKASDRADGYMSICRECHKANVYANRELKREQYQATRRAYLAIPENYQAELERHRQWRLTEHGKAVQAEARRAWAVMHPEHNAEILRRNWRKQNERRKALRAQARAA
jgi:hypothetical protein